MESLGVILEQLKERHKNHIQSPTWNSQNCSQSHGETIPRSQKTCVTASHMPKRQENRNCSEIGNSASLEQVYRDKYRISKETYDANRELIISVEEAQERCRTCNGTCWRTGSFTGLIPTLQIVGDKVYEADRLCKFELQKRNLERMGRHVKNSKIPKIYEGTSFNDFKVTALNQDAVEAVRYLIRNNASGNGFFLWGPSGTGKTMLASILANELLKLGRSVMFLNVTDFMFEMRAAIRKDGREILQEVKDIDVLILDDLGSERVTSWVSENIFMLLNYRCNNNLCTVITSNYNLDLIVSRFASKDNDGNMDKIHGQRLASRIVMMCNIIEITGDDQRMMNSIKQEPTGKVLNLSHAKR